MIYLLSSIFSLLKAEPLVLYPSIIVAFTGSWLLRLLKINIQEFTISSPVFTYLIVSGILQIFNQLLVSDLAKTFLKEKNVFFGKSLGKSLLRFLPALLSINILLVVMTGLVLISRYSLVSSLLAFPLLFLLIIIFQLLPIIYVSSGQSIFQIFSLIFIFFRNKFRQAIFLVFFGLFIFTSTFLLLSLSEGLPANIKSILSPIIQGLANTILIYTVIMLYSNLLPHQVNTKA